MANTICGGAAAPSMQTLSHQRVEADVITRCQASRPAEVPHKFKPGEIVLFKPSNWCPSIWRPLAEHLRGQFFEYIANAQGAAGETLVLQDFPCTDVFPSYFLAPAECLITEQEMRRLNERDAYTEAERRAEEAAQ